MKRFLLVFWLDAPRAEHAKLKAEIDNWAAAKPQIAFTNTNAAGASLIGWLAISARPLADLSIDRCLFREDRHVVMEIGEQTLGDGFGDVRQWLWDTRFR